MLIGLISDTHDHVPHVKQAVRLFKERDVDFVIHCGDYCSPFTIPPFKGLELKGIFGNNDGDKYLLMQKFNEINGKLHGHFFELDVHNQSLAVYHSTYQPITDALTKCGKYDAVISGHTHEKRSETIEGCLAVNPGTAHGFGDSATVAVLQTDMMEVEFLTLN